MIRSEQGGIFFRLLFLMFFFGFLALLYVARHPVMRLAGQFWVVDEPVAQADALIVLGDDNYAGDRAFHAAELYREGVARVVVASGRMLRQNVSVADIMEHDLESFGVPAAAIVKLTHRAQNTREEATESAKNMRLASPSETKPSCFALWTKVRSPSKYPPVFTMATGLGACTPSCIHVTISNNSSSVP